jgi:hypothetical protein
VQDGALMTVAQWNVSQNQFPADVQTKDVGNVSAAVLDAIVRALQLDDWVTPCIPTATSLTVTPRSPDLGDLKAKPTDRAQAQNGGSARVLARPFQLLGTSLASADSGAWKSSSPWWIVVPAGP